MTMMPMSAYAKFWEANKVDYGRYASDEFTSYFTHSIAHKDA